MQTFLISDEKKLMLSFLSEKKKKNMLDIQKQCIHKLGKIQSELKFLFGVYY